MNNAVKVLCVVGLGAATANCQSLQRGQTTTLAALNQGSTSSAQATSLTAPVQSGLPNTSAATWQMPWQIMPVAYGSAAHREPIAEAIVPGTGRVRGTPAALKTIGQPLVGSEGENRTVASCRNKVAQEASRFGAKDVEAVSAGREIFQNGVIVAPVRVRITYDIRGKFEVRESTLSCVASPSGNVLDAYAVNGNKRNT